MTARRLDIFVQPNLVRHPSTSWPCKSSHELTGHAGVQGFPRRATGGEGSQFPAVDELEVHSFAHLISLAVFTVVFTLDRFPVAGSKEWNAARLLGKRYSYLENGIEVGHANPSARLCHAGPRPNSASLGTDMLSGPVRLLSIPACKARPHASRPAGAEPNGSAAYFKATAHTLQSAIGLSHIPQLLHKTFVTTPVSTLHVARGWHTAEATPVMVDTWGARG